MKNPSGILFQDQDYSVKSDAQMKSYEIGRIREAGIYQIIIYFLLKSTPAACRKKVCLNIDMPDD
jgi:hypothetical protein